MLCLVRYLFVISTSVIDCLGRFVAEMTYYVSSGTLNLSKPNPHLQVFASSSISVGVDDRRRREGSPSRHRTAAFRRRSRESRRAVHRLDIHHCRRHRCRLASWQSDSAGRIHDERSLNFDRVCIQRPSVNFSLNTTHGL